MSTRSLYKEIFKNFINSLSRNKSKGKLMGKDYNGTEYYESIDTKYLGRKPRWFIPIEKDNFEQEIPPEWTAWLTYKRSQPPTEEEIQYNIQKMKKTIENAKALEKSRGEVTEPEVKSLEKTSFPKYNEYEEEPGVKSKNV